MDQVLLNEVKNPDDPAGTVSAYIAHILNPSSILITDIIYYLVKRITDKEDARTAMTEIFGSAMLSDDEADYLSGQLAKAGRKYADEHK